MRFLYKQTGRASQKRFVSPVILFLILCQTILAYCDCDLFFLSVADDIESYGILRAHVKHHVNDMILVTDFQSFSSEACADDYITFHNHSVGDRIAAYFVNGNRFFKSRYSVS